MIDTIAPSSVLSDFTFKKSLADPASNELDKNAFLKLLVAQLKYQDPLNPSDPADFMATTAQFTTIEKLDELTQQGANNAIVNGLSMASSLVGRSVDYIADDDSVQSAVVNSAQVVAGQVRLMTDKGPVDMSSITGIGRVDTSPPTVTPTAAPAVAAPVATAPNPTVPTTTAPTTGADPTSTGSQPSSDPVPLPVQEPAAAAISPVNAPIPEQPTNDLTAAEPTTDQQPAKETSA